MPQKRPTSVLVMAILNLVFGGPGLVCVCCGGIGLAAMFGMAGSTPELSDMFTLLDKEVPSNKPVMIIELMFSLLLAIVLIASGVGLLSMQTWARWGSVGYAVVSIPLKIADLAYTLFVLNPAMANVSKQLKHAPAGMTGSPAQGVGTIIGGSLFILYALCLLVVMFLPDVSAAFRGDRPRRRKRPATYEEDAGYERRPRRREESEEE